MNHENYKELLSAFLDGELSEAERADVLAHLGTCEACRTYFAELTAMHDAFGDMEDIDAPEGFAEGVLARLHEEAAESAWTPQEPKRRVMWRRWAGFAACAAIVLLAGSMWRFTRMGMGVSSDNSSPSAFSGAPASSAESFMTTASSAPAAAAPDYDLHAYTTEDAPETAEYLEAPAEPSAPEAAANSENGAPFGNGMEGSAGTEDEENAAVVLTLYGEGAEEWLMAHCLDNYAGDNLYVVADEALYALPEGLTLGDGEAVGRWRALDVGFVAVRAAETEAAP